MCLCLGPAKSGKTFLMKRLQGDDVDDATHTVSTNGINLFIIKNCTGEFDMIVKEIGGNMALIWKHYFDKIRKLIYVVDASNLCQISAAGVLLYSLLVEPRLRTVKIALTLNKMDLSYRQMRNEALLMLQYSRLQKEVTQQLTIFETSGMTGQGIEELRNWLFDPATLKAAIDANK
ncbi:PREDICTED: ADP-ribosylation factor-like protein 16 [Dufourea novaeangliae]|uniref:ADP-ribosylation factor-like protein 16 n=1 Tax=Dufourea novaeangliae TaxID=178035 RepID=A0A154PH85_DUFNO|nr:PREDICTED: ADP-ribosylation factor-like protein 16 [Dufourea novaeangliae]KZC11203.1 ADP-ribosylation factor-like protein 16 [Dufourea novaeangliae]